MNIEKVISLLVLNTDNKFSISPVEKKYKNKMSLFSPFIYVYKISVT